MKTLTTTAMILLVMTQTAHCQSFLPGGAEPLHKVLRSVESQGVQPVKVFAQHRKWVVEGIAANESVRLQVDPRTGRVIERKTIKDLEPIDAPLQLSTVIHRLEEANPGPIWRVRFHRGLWLIETRRGKRVTEVKVTADTGELAGGRDE